MENNNSGLFDQAKVKKETENVDTVTISQKVIFFDIETAPRRDVRKVIAPTGQDNNVYEYDNYDNMPEREKGLRLNRYAEKNDIAKMSIYPEFGQIVCISAGFFFGTEKKLRSIVGEEKNILEDFAKLCNVAEKLVGHNSIGFDAPYVEKRMLVHNIKVPKILQGSALSPKGLRKSVKPREAKVEDTMQMRKGIGGMSAGLDTICMALGFPSPKKEFDGSQVAARYRSSRHGTLKDKFNAEISQYCEGDVMATMDVYKRLLFCYL